MMLQAGMMSCKYNSVLKKNNLTNDTHEILHAMKAESSEKEALPLSPQVARHVVDFAIQL